MTKPVQNINIGGIEKGSYKRINESLKIAKLVNYDKQYGLKMKTTSTNDKKLDSLQLQQLKFFI